MLSTLLPEPSDKKAKNLSKYVLSNRAQHQKVSNTIRNLVSDARYIRPRKSFPDTNTNVFTRSFLSQVPRTIQIRSQDTRIQEANKICQEVKGANLQQVLRNCEANLPNFSTHFTTICENLLELDTDAKLGPGFLWQPSDTLFTDLKIILREESVHTKQTILYALDTLQNYIALWTPSFTAHTIFNSYWYGEVTEKIFVEEIIENGENPEDMEYIKRADLDAAFPPYALHPIAVEPIKPRQAWVKKLIKLTNELQTSNPPHWFGYPQPASVFYWGQEDTLTGRVFDEEVEHWTNSGEFHNYCAILPINHTNDLTNREAMLYALHQQDILKQIFQVLYHMFQLSEHRSKI